MASLQEGLSTPTGQGVSVMDVKNEVAPPVKRALTRNYSDMMKLIDQKKGKK